MFLFKRFVYPGRRNTERGALPRAVPDTLAWGWIRSGTAWSPTGMQMVPEAPCHGAGPKGKVCGTVVVALEILWWDFPGKSELRQEEAWTF